MCLLWCQTLSLREASKPGVCGSIFEGRIWLSIYLPPALLADWFVCRHPLAIPCWLCKTIILNDIPLVLASLWIGDDCLPSKLAFFLSTLSYSALCINAYLIAVVCGAIEWVDVLDITMILWSTEATSIWISCCFINLAIFLNGAIIASPFLLYNWMDIIWIRWNIHKELTDISKVDATPVFEGGECFRSSSDSIQWLLVEKIKLVQG